MNLKITMIAVAVFFVIILAIAGYAYSAIMPHSYTTTLTSASPLDNGHIVCDTMSYHWPFGC